jgi:dipeptidyl aminopeptidase/acylaminoacyl peptidase
VGDYSVALDGRVAYTIENQLLMEYPDGSGRRVLVDGGAIDPNNPYLTRISAPAWSPDGITIAFGYQGLNFYNVITGTYSLALANTFRNAGGLSIPEELYFPRQYSPDGTSLLISIGWYEGGTYAIYRIPSATLVKPLAGGMLCCATIWTSDSSSFYFASSSIGMIESGLWRFNLDGTVTTLLPSSAADGTFNFAEYPYLAPDGQLYYFFNNLPDIPSGHTPLTVVRSAPDGVTGRTSVLPGTFPALNEALWAPDANLVVIADASSMPDEWYAGRLIAIYLDGRPAQVLAPFGSNLKWGP